MAPVGSAENAWSLTCGPTKTRPIVRWWHGYSVSLVYAGSLVQNRFHPRDVEIEWCWAGELRVSGIHIPSIGSQGATKSFRKPHDSFEIVFKSALWRWINPNHTGTQCFFLGVWNTVGFQGPSSGKAVSSPCSCHRKQPSTLDVEPPDELHENPRISVAFCHALPWQRKVCAKACELWVATNGFGWCNFWNLYRVLQIWFVKAP